MTSFIVWVGRDFKKDNNQTISSLNFASDSRISWNYGNGDKWEMGKKLFFSQTSPEIFGFTGDVLICYFILTHIINLIDINNFLVNVKTKEEKQDKIKLKINEIFNSYPNNRKENFSIFYGTRLKESNQSEFALLKIKYDKTEKDLTFENLDLSKQDFYLDGSGEAVIKNQTYDWEITALEKQLYRFGERLLSREYFSLFCEAIESNKDKQSNNIAQIVSLYRSGTAKPTAYVHQDKNTNHKRIYFYGIEYDSPYDNTNIEFRNKLFERCDKNGEVLQKAQRQPKVNQPKNKVKE